MPEQIRAAMRAAGMNQRALARALGVTDPRINHILNARRVNGLTVRSLERIAEAMGRKLVLRFEDPDETVRLVGDVISDALEQGHQTHWCAEWTARGGRCELCDRIARQVLAALEGTVDP